MTKLRRKMREDLQLTGYSQRTVDSYIATVRVLAKYYNRSPALLTEDEIRLFFVHLIVCTSRGSDCTRQALNAVTWAREFKTPFLDIPAAYL